jgi:hypothetical protein
MKAPLIIGTGSSQDSEKFAALLFRWGKHGMEQSFSARVFTRE